MTNTCQLSCLSILLQTNAYSKGSLRAALFRTKCVRKKVGIRSSDTTTATSHHKRVVPTVTGQHVFRKRCVLESRVPRVVRHFSWNVKSRIHSARFGDIRCPEQQWQVHNLILNVLLIMYFFTFAYLLKLKSFSDHDMCWSRQDDICGVIKCNCTDWRPCTEQVDIMLAWYNHCHSQLLNYTTLERTFMVKQFC